MKRIVRVVAILALSFLIFGCGKARSGQNLPQDSNVSSNSTPNASVQTQKPTAAEVDAQADKVQKQIGQLLNDLDKDSDDQNINTESK